MEEPGERGARSGSDAPRPTEPEGLSGSPPDAGDHGGRESGPEEGLSPAAALYADLIARRGAGQEVDFEELCAAYPDLESEMRRLHEGVERVRMGVLRGAGLDGCITSSSSSSHEQDEAAPGAGIRAGQVIGDFRLLALLGRGGMGQVWEAEQTSLRRRVALKLVHPERVDKRRLKLFAREARAGGRLAHAGIVTVYGSGESDGYHWIAQELVPGGRTLRDYIDRLRAQAETPFEDYTRIARFAAELADALQAAHDADVIHRDLKPQNVLVTSENRPKLTDFGLARIRDEKALSRTGEFAGTYYYTSPEQVSGRRMGLDHRTDVFSLGVVLYEMLALTRPFEGDTVHQVSEKVLTHDPPNLKSIRSRIPLELSVIVGKAMEKRPDRRYPTMADFAADLRRYLADEPILARTPSRAQRLLKWARRHPTKSVATSITSVAAVVLLVLAAAYNRKSVEAANELARVDALSGLREMEVLIGAADELWPPHPDQLERLEHWRARAAALEASLATQGKVGQVDLEAWLGQLQARVGQALELSTDSPLRSKIEAQAVKVDALERARLHRESPADLEVIELVSPPSGDVALVVKAARALAHPDDRVYGMEGQALALARWAFEREPTDLAALHALAWALFANGLVEDAIGCMDEILPQAPSDRREAYERSRERLIEEGNAQETKLTEARAELEELRAAAAQVRAVDLPTIREISALLDPEEVSPSKGWSVARRIDEALALKAAFASGGEFAQRWQDHEPELRRTYPGLDLSMQMGLVPLGRDPGSGMFEFWHVLSGSEPEWGPDGVVPYEDMGLVFVLLPGGRFTMGSQRLDPHAPNHISTQTHDNELHPHDVWLSPFFLSKYEMTQAQWQRLSGANPSHWAANSRTFEISALHPVENLSWNESVQVLARFQLGLPTEAQWEYACRSRTTTPCSFVPAEGIEFFANIRDTSYEKGMGVSILESHDDGFPVHAPVGSLLPNAFGLFDVHGNVWEWCQDEYYPQFYVWGALENPVAPERGRDSRVFRGGSYIDPLMYSRSAIRQSRAPHDGNSMTGIRPARSIRP